MTELMWQREFFVQAIEVMARTIEKKVGTTAEVATIRQVREVIRTINVPQMEKGWRAGDTGTVHVALKNKYPGGYKHFPVPGDKAF